MSERMGLGSRIQGLTELIISDYGRERVIDRLEMFTQPDRQVIEELIGKLLRLVYPGFFRDYSYRIINPRIHLAALIEDVAFHLKKQIGIALRSSSELAEEAADRKAEEITAVFLEKLPEIRDYVETDLQAFYDGDPAASSKEEVIIAYPGFYAITVNRLAHVLYELEVPLIPRIITEMAHSETGIDIHPGAKIGHHFTIDHGTGVVIGATCIIGNYVKLYQGVTLGAKSFTLDEDGNPVKGIARHPILEDNVIVYSNATVLGRITLARGTVIGGNVWVTESTKPGEQIVQAKKRKTQVVRPEDWGCL